MLTYLFGISLFCIVTLISFKMFEIGAKRETVVGKTLKKLDPSVEKHIGVLRGKVESGTEQTRSFLTKDLPENAKSMAQELKNIVREKYVTLLPNVRGTKQLGQNGSVSEFLRDIKKNKDENGSGRIDD